MADAGVINYVAPPTREELVKFGFSSGINQSTITEGSYNPFEMDDDDFDFDDC